MTATCTSQPISWLRLERYALGELPEVERSAVAAHLEDCDLCRSCMAEIRDREVTALPALPVGVLTAPAPWWRRHKLRVAWGGGFAAAAAAAATVAIILSTRVGGVRDESSLPARRIQIKGGEVALDLIRERGGSVGYEPDAFLPEDRFKILFTCPSPAAMHVEVVVYQDGEASFPLPPTTVECGNRVALAGAFRITGRSPAVVCALFDEGAPPDRARLASARPEDLEGAVCTALEPAPTSR